MSCDRTTLSWVFGVGNAAISVGLIAGIAWADGAEAWLGRVLMAAAAVALLAGGLGALRGTVWGLRALRAGALCGLSCACAAAIALGIGVAYLKGVHEAASGRLAAQFIVIMALVLPYLVIYPWMQLLWARKQLENLGALTHTAPRTRPASSEAVFAQTLEAER